MATLNATDQAMVDRAVNDRMQALMEGMTAQFSTIGLQITNAMNAMQAQAQRGQVSQAQAPQAQPTKQNASARSIPHVLLPR